MEQKLRYTKELLLEILKEGNAEVLEEYKRYNQRLVVKFRCVCGEETSKRFEMLNTYRYPYCEKCSLRKKAEKCEKTCMEKYGVKNAAMLPETREKIEKAYEEKYGDHPKRVKEVHDKWVQTCLEKYGGHPNQNREVQIKAEKNSYKFKEYTFPSGKVVKFQGYEDLAFNELLKTIEENDIIIGRGEVPIIKYQCEETKRVYFPDIYIKSHNKIIEVKSEWTVKLKTARIEEKAKAVKEKGYQFEVWIYSSKKVRTETRIL